MEIVNHPLCNKVLGAPSDIQDGSCESLPVVEYEDEYGRWSLSFWKPSEDELSVLNSGGHIGVHIRATGRQHPVIGLNVHTD